MGAKVYDTRTECENKEGKKCTWKDFSESETTCCNSTVKCAVPCEEEIKPCECLTDCEKESTQEDCEVKSGKKCKPFKCASFFGQCCNDNNSCWEPCDDQESLEPCACDNSICRLYPTQDECEEIEQYACIRATCEAGSEKACCRANSDCWEPCRNPTGQSCICGEGNCLDMFETKEICEQNVSPKRCTKTGKCFGSAEDCCTEASCWQEAPICQCSDYGLLTEIQCEAKAFPNFDEYCQKESVGRGAPDCNENFECYVFVRPTNLCTACYDTYDTFLECESERLGKFDKDRWECRTGYHCPASSADNCVALRINYSATVSFTFSTTITMTFPDCDCADCVSMGDEVFDSLKECNSYLRRNLEDKWKKCVNFSCARSGSKGFCNVNSECARTQLTCDPPPPGKTCDDCDYGPNEFPATEEGRRSCELNAQQTIGSKWDCCYSCEKARTESTNDAGDCLCYRLTEKDLGSDSCCKKCCGIPEDQFFITEPECKNSKPTFCDSRKGLEWACNPADCGGCCQGQCIRGICQTPLQTCKGGCLSDPTLMDWDTCEAIRQSLPPNTQAKCDPKDCAYLPLAKCYYLNESTSTPTRTICTCNEVNSRCHNLAECERIANGPLCPARAPDICVCSEVSECSKECPNGQPNPGNCVKLEEVRIDCNTFAQVCRGEDGKSYNAATGECEAKKEEMRKKFPDYIWACEGCTEVASYRGKNVEIKCEKLVSSPDRCCTGNRGEDCLSLAECSKKNYERCSNSCLGPKCMSSCRVTRQKPCPPVSGFDRCQGRFWDCATNSLQDCERCEDFKSCWVSYPSPGGSKPICKCDTHNTTGPNCPPDRPPC
jgi:hypothetical protein